MSIPQDILAASDALAEEEEMMAASDLADFAPQGQFSAIALNALVNEVNKILPKMGMPSYPVFEGDQTVFPPEFVDVISGIAMAAENADMDVEIDLAAIEEDRDISLLAGTIATLAEDEEFLAFLAEGEEPEEVVEEETVVEEPMPGGGEEVIEDEELFMQRM